MNKKIIFINRFFYPDHSATSLMLSDLAFYLAEQEYDVYVICSHQSYDQSTDLLPKKESINGVTVCRITTSNFGRNWLPGRVIDYLSYFLGMGWELFQILKSNDIVVAKTDPPLTSVVTLTISKIKGARHINWIQDLFPEVAKALGFNNYFLTLLQRIRNWSFKHSIKTVVIGEVMKSTLLEEGLDESSIQIIPNWSDSDIVYPVESISNPLRDIWNLRGKHIVGYSGNMGRVHEFDTIIAAANELKDNSSITFIFIGDGPQKQHIKKQVERLELKNVLFFPYQPYDRLSDSLSLPDIHLLSLKAEIEGYCVPSKYYGIIATGKPSIFIGDKNGEISKIINRDSSGLQVDCGNYSDLANQITHLFENREQLLDLSNNARISFLEKYDKKYAMNRWRSLLENL